jgi:pimeloyl-ACP methyl ester carboxylesterase
MGTEFVSFPGGTFAVVHVGDQRDDLTDIVWGHGWNHSSSALLPMATSLAHFAFSSLIDFPGFGRSPMPPEVWGTADYADAVAGWLNGLPPRRRIWVGHSFGCRVGIQLAARHPGLLSGMVLMAAAGLPRKRTFMERLGLFWRRSVFQIAKLVAPEGPARNRLRARFGSADYQAAAAMRPILVRVVNENLASTAAKVECPVLLIYGANDRDTPPEMGRRFQSLIPRAELVILDGFDHLGLLDEGRHQAVYQIQRFLKSLRP